MHYIYSTKYATRWP